MKKIRHNIRWQFIFWLCVAKTGSGFAQEWTEKDSVWLQNILSGKEEIRLNPEFQRAIESGSLISTDIISTEEQMIEAPAILPVIKDFSEYLAPAKKEKEVDALSLPPAVFWLYGLDIPLPKVYKAFIVPGEIKRNARKPSGVSFDDALRSIFSPADRARARNRKNATAWKRYNNF